MEPSKTTSQVRGQPSAGEIAENGVRSRRTIKLTRKALHNAIDNKRKEFRNSRKRLLSILQLVDGLGDDSDILTLARDLNGRFRGIRRTATGLVSAVQTRCVR